MLKKYIKSKVEIEIMNLFLENPQKIFGLVEITKKAKVSYLSTQYTIPRLKRRGLIRINRKVGKSNLYQLNDLNAFNQAIMFIE